MLVFLAGSIKAIQNIKLEGNECIYSWETSKEEKYSLFSGHLNSFKKQVYLKFKIFRK